MVGVGKNNSGSASWVGVAGDEWIGVTGDEWVGVIGDEQAENINNSNIDTTHEILFIFVLTPSR